MRWTYVRNGHRRTCGLRASGTRLLLEVSYEFAASPIVEPFPAVEPSLCAQMALERSWVSAGWSLECFTPDE
jgi:hypothetical protein